MLSIHYNCSYVIVDINIFIYCIRFKVIMFNVCDIITLSSSSITYCLYKYLAIYIIINFNVFNFNEIKNFDFI